MDASELKEIEDLAVCGVCKQRYNEMDYKPKLLMCKHYFCTVCIRNIMQKGSEIYCVHCWKRTELITQNIESLPTYNPALVLSSGLTTVSSPSSNTFNYDEQLTEFESKGEICNTHSISCVLWCHTCSCHVCAICTSTNDNNVHQTHHVTSFSEAKDKLVSNIQNESHEISKSINEAQKLISEQRQYLLKVVEACVILKAYLESDLQNKPQITELEEARNALTKTQVSLKYINNPQSAHLLHQALINEKQKLQLKCNELHLQCRTDSIIKNASIPFDFTKMQQMVENLHSPQTSHTDLSSTSDIRTTWNPILFLANYCTSQLYTRNYIFTKETVSNRYQQQNGTPEILHSTSQNLLAICSPTQRNAPAPYSRPINPLPAFYFTIEINGTPFGRIVIETRPDVAPKMARNFAALTLSELGYGYRGCHIFQCWISESVITGDFESNNGRGGRSVFDEYYFVPDDTKFQPVRGAVGMRRTQKKHDSLGMVGSQFRIILQEMRGFTGIFGHVVEGIDLVEKISTLGDPAGKPTKSITIANCGQL